MHWEWSFPIFKFQENFNSPPAFTLFGSLSSQYDNIVSPLCSYANISKWEITFYLFAILSFRHWYHERKLHFAAAGKFSVIASKTKIHIREIHAHTDTATITIVQTQKQIFAFLFIFRTLVRAHLLSRPSACLPSLSILLLLLFHFCVYMHCTKMWYIAKLAANRVGNLVRELIISWKMLHLYHNI